MEPFRARTSDGFAGDAGSLSKRCCDATAFCCDWPHDRTGTSLSFLPGKSVATGRLSRALYEHARASVCRRSPWLGTRSFTSLGHDPYSGFGRNAGPFHAQGFPNFKRLNLRGPAIRGCVPRAGQSRNDRQDVGPRNGLRPCETPRGSWAVPCHLDAKRPTVDVRQRSRAGFPVGVFVTQVQAEPAPGTRIRILTAGANRVQPSQFLKAGIGGSPRLRHYTRHMPDDATKAALCVRICGRRTKTWSLWMGLDPRGAAGRVLRAAGPNGAVQD